MSKIYKFFTLLKLRYDRILSRSLGWQLVLLFIAMGIALALSYLFLSWSGADWNAFCKKVQLPQWLLPIYLLIDSNALNNLYIETDIEKYPVHGWMLIASTFTFIVGTVLFSGFIIGIITTTIERRVNKYKEGNTFYLKKGHYIIMGYDEMASSVISHILNTDPDAYILLLTSAEADKIREKLLKSFSSKEMKKIIINYGHRVSTDIFDDIHLDRAKEVFVVGNHSKPAHDAINVESVDAICRFLSRPEVNSKPSRITCMFKDIDTYAAFKTTDIFKKVEQLGIEFVPYNIQTGWATQVFVNRRYRDFDNAGISYPYPRMYAHGITKNDNRYVHLLFVGTTNFAVAFAMEAANVLHFPNGSRRNTLITFIDRNMDREKDEFITRNRHFFEVQPYLWRDLSAGDEAPREMHEYIRFDAEDAGFLDVQFEFIKGDIFSKNVQDELQRLASRNNREEYLSIFLALADQRENFVIGMNMPDEVYDNGVNLFIRQDRSDNFVTDLRSVDSKNETEKLPYRTMGQDGECHTELRDARYANIYPFGMNETAYFIDEISLRQAKLINYLYSTADYSNSRFLTEEQLDAIPAEKIWADADNRWRELTVAKKWSNLYSAYTIPVKLDVLRTMRGLPLDDTSQDFNPLSPDQVEQLARLEHDRWNVEKLLMGFRKPTPCEDKYLHPEVAEDMKKNKDLFIHHDIRPFEGLDNVAELDREFSRFLPWVLKMTVGSGSNESFEEDADREEYRPQPLDTSDVKLNPELEPLAEQLAEHVHETWALGRYKEGWRFGSRRNDAKKLTPCMKPYDLLPEKEKDYDRATSLQTLRFIVKKGFKITK